MFTAILGLQHRVLQASLGLLHTVQGLLWGCITGFRLTLGLYHSLRASLGRCIIGSRGHFGALIGFKGSSGAAAW